MNKKAILPLLLIIALGVTYYLNPLGTASFDPRARLTGFLPYTISAQNMSSTLQRDDNVIATTYSYYQSSPKVNDIVLYKSTSEQSEYATGRVIAIADQKLRIKQGVVYVNNQAQKQPFIDPLNNLNSSDSQIDELNIEKDHLFILGDNRDNSQDSRSFGPVPVSSVIGKIAYKWSFEDGFSTEEIK